MKYTIPYEDKINLPHIKELLNIDLQTGEITKEQEDLVGKVIVFGEYTLDNSEDVMEFTHEIPISLLVDDTDIAPIISFSSFEYELVKGRCIEIMFDLDVAIETREDQFQKEMDEKLDEAIGVKRDDAFEALNQELNVFAMDKEEKPMVEEVMAEDSEVEVPEVEDMADSDEDEFYVEDLIADDDAGLEMMVDLDLTQEEDRIGEHHDGDDLLEDLLDVNHDHDNYDEDNYNDDDLFQELAPEIEKAEVEYDIDDKCVGHHVKVMPSDQMTQFDIGFISNTNDKYTTYKVLLLEEDELIEDILEAKGLSRDLIVDEFDRSDRKIVLKIDDE